MTEPDQIKTASRFMLRYVCIILAISFFLAAAFVYYGSQQKEMWCSYATIAGDPSIEVVVDVDGPFIRE